MTCIERHKSGILKIRNSTLEKSMAYNLMLLAEMHNAHELNCVKSRLEGAYEDSDLCA